MIVLGRVIVGLGMLTLGRKLFWLFVGGIGFVWGTNLATHFLTEQSETMVLLLGLVVGLIGAVMAMTVQKLAVGAAGFLGGAIVAVQLVEMFSINVGSVLIPFVVGGVLGLIVVSVLFDWALVVLSSLTGAQVIVEAMGWERPLSLIVMVIFTAVGIAVQAGQIQRGIAKG